MTGPTSGGSWQPSENTAALFDRVVSSVLETAAKEVQTKTRNLTEGLKFELLTKLKDTLHIELGRCPLSDDAGYRMIDRFLGEPRLDKSTERKLEAIPKFSGSGNDPISITDFLERVTEMGKNEPTLTKIYFLKMRLDGFL